MTRMSVALVAVLALMVATFTAKAYAQEAPIKVAKTEKGEFLTDPTGMTLYTYDRDGEGESKCNAKCAENWPPLMGQATDPDVGPYSLITRQDGSVQWSFRGMPLYRYKGDKAPGDMSGDGKEQKRKVKDKKTGAEKEVSEKVWRAAQP
ncbi:MAG: hypothetical protein HY423_10760 [Candidatus Lambdaproteobacteria bacterium]|nr:hypothetical protein [Candidatus Lambdaproteobacteria bacterium]